MDVVLVLSTFRGVFEGRAIWRRDEVGHSRLHAQPHQAGPRGNDAGNTLSLVASPFRGVVDGCVSLQHSLCGREGESQRVEEWNGWVWSVVLTLVAVTGIEQTNDAERLRESLGSGPNPAWLGVLSAVTLRTILLNARTHARTQARR
jgi:hypothetical protein